MKHKNSYLEIPKHARVKQALITVLEEQGYAFKTSKNLRAELTLTNKPYLYFDQDGYLYIISSLFIGKGNLPILTLKDFGINEEEILTENVLGYVFKPEYYNELKTFLEGIYLREIDSTYQSKNVHFLKKTYLYHKLKRLKVLDIWCTPVNKLVQYSEGDWITVIAKQEQLVNSWVASIKGQRTFQVLKELKDGFYVSTKGHNHNSTAVNCFLIQTKHIRKATTEEIAKVAPFEIDGYAVEFSTDKSFVYIKNNKFNYEQIQELLRTMEYLSVVELQITKERSTSIKFTIQDLLKLYSRLIPETI